MAWLGEGLSSAEAITTLLETVTYARGRSVCGVQLVSLADSCCLSVHIGRYHRVWPLCAQLFLLGPLSLVL